MVEIEEASSKSLNTYLSAVNTLYPFVVMSSQAWFSTSSMFSDDDRPTADWV